MVFSFFALCERDVELNPASLAQSWTVMFYNVCVPLWVLLLGFGGWLYSVNQTSMTESLFEGCVDLRKTALWQTEKRKKKRSEIET